MSQVNVRADRPVSLDAYDYLRAAAPRDWAWEYLRRNGDYRAAALLHHDYGIDRRRLAAGPLLTRLRAQQEQAEAWGLCCFR